MNSVNWFASATQSERNLCPLVTLAGAATGVVLSVQTS